MNNALSRREFVGAASATLVATAMASQQTPSRPRPIEPVTLPPRFTKTRVLRAYVAGHRPSWPKPDLDLGAEMKRVTDAIDRAPGIEDVAFVGNRLVQSPDALVALLKESGPVDGVLAIPLCLGTSPLLAALGDAGVATMLLCLPYSGHEWCLVPDMQASGRKIEVLPTSDLNDVADAVRPFRAIHRLKETKVLYVSGHAPAPEAYVNDVRDRFGTEIRTLDHKALVAAYDAVDPAAAEADAERWIRNAQRVREPSREEIAKSARFCLALEKVLQDENAHAITINCLGLFGAGALPAYPCFGFARLNDIGLAGVCEADLPSTMTQIIFQHMTGRTGFVTDPLFDLATDTVIHAHCVAATKMDGPAGPAAPYEVRSHLEDNRGAVLQVKMRVGQDITMAKLVAGDRTPLQSQPPRLAASPPECLGTDTMLISTGEIIDVPDSDRGCRTQITTRVRDARKMLDGWSHGLHRVIFYGHHVADARRLGRFTGFKIVEEC